MHLVPHGEEVCHEMAKGWYISVLLLILALPYVTHS
jgi:hypothetical protein